MRRRQAAFTDSSSEGVGIGNRRRRRGGGRLLDLLTNKHGSGSPRSSRRAVLDFFQNVRSVERLSVSIDNNQTRRHHRSNESTGDGSGSRGSFITTAPSGANDTASPLSSALSSLSSGSRAQHVKDSLNLPSVTWAGKHPMVTSTRVIREQDHAPSLTTAFATAPAMIVSQLDSLSPPSSPESLARRHKRVRTGSPSIPRPTVFSLGRPAILSLPNPLHGAVSSGASSQVLQEMVRRDPESTTVQNNGGMTPLHCAVERYDTSTDMLLVLLSSNPQAAKIRNQNGENSVDLLWKRFIAPDDFRSQEIKDRAAQLRDLMRVECRTGFSVDLQTRAQVALAESAQLNEFWSMMIIFIKAACHGTTVVDSCLLHDAVKLECDPLLIQFAHALHPSEVYRYNADGQLPLHVAATSGSSDFVLAVLSLNPQAACQRDHSSGRLPLHSALENKKLVWGDGTGMEELVRANPLAISAADPQTELLPVGLAAAESNLSNVYGLVCQSLPEVCERVFLRPLSKR